MNSIQGTSSSHGTTGKHMAQYETHDQLLDVFKAAALSVTKLYKTSAEAQTRVRSEGYRDCLEDLLRFLDREDLGLRDGEGWRIRAWATERLDGRDMPLQATESEDELDRNERTISPDVAQTSTDPPVSTFKLSEPPASTVLAIPEERPCIVVPTQDNFTFQSPHPYPNIATLDLSDTRPDGSSIPTPRSSKTRLGGPKSGSRTSGHLGRGAGAKRRWDFEDFFGGCLNGKDPFSSSSKRSRHT